jgi:hypothetical protein
VAVVRLPWSVYVGAVRVVATVQEEEACRGTGALRRRGLAR